MERLNNELIPLLWGFVSVGVVSLLAYGVHRAIRYLANKKFDKITKQKNL